MATRFTDAQIVEFLSERKPLPADYLSRMAIAEKRGHREGELEITGANGNRFLILVRQSDTNVLDFSAILGVVPKGSNQVFRLKRYNGKSHEHTNRIEKMSFYDFHIHTATERYQELGAKEEYYASPTDRYEDLEGAIACMVQDCAFEIQPTLQMNLFEGMTK